VFTAGYEVDMSRRVLATMITVTTYGSWLRGDARGWVDDGVVFPADRELEETDRLRMKHDPYRFPKDRLLDVGTMLGDSLHNRLQQRIFALTVQAWHVHVVVGASPLSVAQVVKCLKDAARWGLRVGQPIWSDGYDKRFCFDEATVAVRVRYVERHNVQNGWTVRPWQFLEDFHS
jgi:hypothetical protein